MQIIYTIFISMLFMGCSVTSLSYDNSYISLSLDNQHLKLHAKTIERQNDNFGKLYLYRRVLQTDDNRVLIYEKAKLDDQYELNFSTTRTVSIVFETIRVNQLYANRGFYLYQLLLKDGSVLNLAVEQFLDQEIVFVYGMKTSQMRELLKELNATTNRPLVDSVLLLDRATKDIIKSRWSSQKVHFAPLITPLRLIFGR